MNFGRFFKLNQNLSDMAAGVTIFDYTELPVFEGLDYDNSMSPKYPIKMTITENAVRFKMHYCLYRCSNEIRQTTKNEDKEPYPYYGFSIDDIMQKLYKNYPKETYEQDIINAVHIEEIILDLPFSGYQAKSLTEIIKKSYIANFPQIYEDDEPDNNVLTGNRFLDNKIKKELSSKNHNIDTDAVSYSTLWLMDLYETNGKLNLKGDTGLVDKFLRKLLLDFMFDLKHSNVFQTCTDYDRMYSELMSDYYFSALMHKCEYYYYRELTTQAINSLEEKKKQYNQEGKDKKELESDQKKIIHLYAKELFEAEEQWANDIRNPLSEKLFENKFPDDFSESRESQLGHPITKFFSIFKKYYPNAFSKSINLIKIIKSQLGQLKTKLYSIFVRISPDVFSGSSKLLSSQSKTMLYSIFGERMTTKCWDSWFACPEEEMRRIYFPSKTYNNNIDICNSVTLVEYFYNSPNIKELLLLAKDSQAKSSRWFLNRYDFNDVLHLHLFKHANILFLCLALILLAILWFSGSMIDLANLLSFSYLVINNIPIILAILVISINLFGLFLAYKHKKTNTLREYHYRHTLKKLWIISFLLLPLFILLYLINNNHEWQTIIKTIILGAFLFILLLYSSKNKDLVSCDYPCKYPKRYLDFIKNGHLFLPKLTASIMTAWLTLSRGIHYFIPFFESYMYVFILTVIVFGFIMYQINKICPNNSTLTKWYKSFEFLIISYCISLIVGLVVINFAGKHYLMESGYLNDNYTEFIECHQSDVILYYSENNGNISVIDMKPLQYNIYLNEDVKRYLYDEKNTKANIRPIPKYRPVVIRLPLIGSKQGILIIPRLWLMSSVLAMFIGVFLQMTFLKEEKEMTDI